jgi:hypothetical protein
MGKEKSKRRSSLSRGAVCSDSTSQVEVWDVTRSAGQGSQVSPVAMATRSQLVLLPLPACAAGLPSKRRSKSMQSELATKGNASFHSTACSCKSSAAPSVEPLGSRGPTIHTHLVLQLETSLPTHFVTLRLSVYLRVLVLGTWDRGVQGGQDRGFDQLSFQLVDSL